jgi:hypothetical protein
MTEYDSAMIAAKCATASGWRILRIIAADRIEYKWRPMVVGINLWTTPRGTQEKKQA